MAGDGRVWKKKENELNEKKEKAHFMDNFRWKSLMATSYVIWLNFLFSSSSFLFLSFVFLFFFLFHFILWLLFFACYYSVGMTCIHAKGNDHEFFLFQFSFLISCFLFQDFHAWRNCTYHFRESINRQHVK